MVTPPRRTERGFALMEVVVTVGIIAILLVAAATLSNGQQLGTARVSLETARARLRYCAQLAQTTGDGATCWFHPSADDPTKQVIEVLYCRPRSSDPSVSDICRRTDRQTFLRDPALPSVVLTTPAHLYVVGGQDADGTRDDFAIFFRPGGGFGYLPDWDGTYTFQIEPPTSGYNAQLTLTFAGLAQALTLKRTEGYVVDGAAV